MADSVTIDIAASGVLPVQCPAGRAIAGVRAPQAHAGGEVPGVLCTIVGETLDLAGDPRGVALNCCHPDREFRNCPIWQADKDRIAAGFDSLAVAGEMDEANEQALREDLTGSPYGDVSFIDALTDAANDAALDMQFNEDGFVHGHGGDDE